LKRGKWQATTLVTILRMAKIRSNMHTCQYAGSVPSYHNQGKRWWSHYHSLGSYQQVPFQVSQKRGSELALHTSGLDCNWLKATIVKKVIVFSVFVKLGIRGD